TAVRWRKTKGNPDTTTTPPPLLLTPRRAVAWSFATTCPATPHGTRHTPYPPAPRASSRRTGARGTYHPPPQPPGSHLGESRTSRGRRAGGGWGGSRAVQGCRGAPARG